MAFSKKSPIGIFDSGIGGLTVVKSVIDQLPKEHIIYFGDTARVPYGIKSIETIRRYALEITDFLLKKNVKMILVACNSVASAARREIRKRSGAVPVLDVIDAGTKAAAISVASTKRIGVIGTLATINSGAYEQSLNELGNDISVISRACPMLVPLAEEGWTDNRIAMEILKMYLDDFHAQKLDALILGCTHYPLFKQSIRKILGNNLNIIDSADAIALMAREYLDSKDLVNDNNKGQFDCYVSDTPQRFRVLAERFLGRKLPHVENIRLKETESSIL